MVIITILGWLPQIVDFFCPELIKLNPVITYSVCTFGLLYYMISVGLFLAKGAPFLRRKYGKATTLKVWEIFVSIGKSRFLFRYMKTVESGHLGRISWRIKPLILLTICYDLNQNFFLLIWLFLLRPFFDLSDPKKVIKKWPEQKTF